MFEITFFHERFFFLFFSLARRSSGEKIHKLPPPSKYRLRDNDKDIFLHSRIYIRETEKKKKNNAKIGKKNLLSSKKKSIKNLRIFNINAYTCTWTRERSVESKIHLFVT